MSCLKSCLGDASVGSAPPTGCATRHSPQAHAFFVPFHPSSLRPLCGPQQQRRAQHPAHDRRLQVFAPQAVRRRHGVVGRRRRAVGAYTASPAAGTRSHGCQSTLGPARRAASTSQPCSSRPPARRRVPSCCSSPPFREEAATRSCSSPTRRPQWSRCSRETREERRGEESASSSPPAQLHGC